MSKELKALKEARKFRHEKDKNLVVIDIDYFNQCLDGIETALKRLEEIDTKTIPNMKEHFDMCNEERIIVRNDRAKLYKENVKLKKAFHALSKEDEKVKKLLSLEIEKNRALDIIKRELNIDEILFSLKGVASAKDYDLVKGALL